MAMTDSESRPPDLPDYERPPIDEVGIGVHFQPIPGYSEAIAGQFRELVQRAYPRFDTQPRIEPVIESMTNQPVTAPLILTPGPRTRVWLVSEDDSTLIQVQDNIFILNWRHRQTAYPRFESLRDEFWNRFQAFRNMLSENGLGRLEISQVEVSYVNWITDRSPEAFLTVAGAAELPIEGLGMPEDQMWMARYLMRDEGVAIARLLVQCQPALRLTEPFVGNGFQFGLTFRSPTPPGVLADERLLELVSLGRSTIVRAFAALTTEAAQEDWGRVS